MNRKKSIKRTKKEGILKTLEGLILSTFALTALSGLTAVVSFPITHNNVIETYKETEEYKNQYNKDVEKVENKFKDDEIDYETLKDEISELETSDYIYAMAKESKDPEIRSLVKIDKVCTLVNFSALGSLAVLSLMGALAHECVDHIPAEKEM